METKNIQKYTNTKYWIDSYNLKYNEQICQEIENLLEDVLPKWQEYYKTINNKEIDSTLLNKLLNDIKYMINKKINSIIIKINKDKDLVIEMEMGSDLWNILKMKIK